MTKLFLALLLPVLLSPGLVAQMPEQSTLLGEVTAGLAVVSSQQGLSAWPSSHGREHVDLAHNDTSKDPYEVDYMHVNQWCAASVATLTPNMTRAVLFYVPQVKRGALPALPARQDSGLRDSCRLGAVWSQVHGPNLVSGIRTGLAAAWGPGTQSTRAELAQNLAIPGSGLWKDVWSWRRGSVTIWLAWTDHDKGNATGSRTMVWMVHDRPRDLDLFQAGLDVTQAAVRLTGLGPALTADVASRGNCSSPTGEPAVQRLSKWLAATPRLPPERRAAALLVADAFVACVQGSGASQDAMSRQGVKFAPGCPQDGPNYAHNFRAEAESLDPRGPAGALAAVMQLQSPCFLEGTGAWPDRVIQQGPKVLRQFGPGSWSPWVHFAMARAHAAKLSFTFRPGEPESLEIQKLSRGQAEQERSAAIAEFVAFIKQQPDAPEAEFAWQEAWRLLAGLPPNSTHFGCGCE